MTSLILASGSASRATLLRNAGVDFQQIPADLDEAPLQQRYADNPVVAALELAKAKALSISAQYPDSYVLGADQTLELQGKLGTKAKTLAEAERQLRAMRGNIHQLHSAVVIARNNSITWSITDSATLQMRDFSTSFLKHYLNTMGEKALTAAGCYQLENLGITLFDNIEGDYFTILGVPLLPVLAQLRYLDLLLT